MGMFDLQNGEQRYEAGLGPPPLTAPIFEQIGYQQAEWQDRRRRQAQQSVGTGDPMTAGEASIAWGFIGAMIGGLIAAGYAASHNWSGSDMGLAVGAGILGGAAAGIAALWAIIGSFLLIIGIITLVLRVTGYVLAFAGLVATLCLVSWGLTTLSCRWLHICQFYFTLSSLPPP